MKRSDNVAWSQLKVGIFVVIALIFLAGGILIMGKQTQLFVPKGRLSVIMTDVAGLKVGAPVWLAGVEVGSVIKIRFEHPKQSNEVEIDLEVEREAMKKIGSDSIITIKTKGLMGEKYLDITPSSIYSETQPKRLMGTQLPKLDDVMLKAGTAFDTLNRITVGLEKGEGSFGRLLKDPHLYDNLSKLTTELDSFLSQVNQGQGSLGKFAHSSESYDKLMSILNRADSTLNDIKYSEGTISKLMYDRQLYDKLVLLADNGVQATQGLQEINKKLNSPDSTIGRLIGDREMYDKGLALLEKADSSVKAFEEVVDRVNRGEGTAGKLITEKELYNRLNAMVENVNALVKDIKENPNRYLKISVF